MWEGCPARWSVDPSVSRRTWTLSELHRAGLHPSLEVHTTHFAREGEKAWCGTVHTWLCTQVPNEPYSPSPPPHTTQVLKLT